MYEVTVNGGSALKVDKDKKGILLNGQPISLQIKEIGNGHFHIMHQNKSYNLEVVGPGEGEKSFILKINGQLIETSAKDEIDLLLKKMGLSTQTVKAVNELKAPMPGMVLEINVKAGQTVAKGEKLLILEAMKMENVLKSPTDVVVKSVEVAQGVNVEKNQVLIRFE